MTRSRIIDRTAVNIPDRLHCRRCHHEWTPRKEVVRLCPKCQTRLWKLPHKDLNRLSDADLLAVAGCSECAGEYPEIQAGA